MLQSRARRIPLVDVDDETQREMVVCLLTQYRILKFVSVNVRETQKLRKPLRELVGVGTYEGLAVATMETPVMEVIHTLVKKDISCVPIVDREGVVLNVFEAVDVIVLIKGGDYENLNLNVGKALEKRSEVSVPLFSFVGVYRAGQDGLLMGFHNYRISLASTPVPSTTVWIPSSTPSVARASTDLSLLTRRGISRAFCL